MYQAGTRALSEAKRLDSAHFLYICKKLEGADELSEREFMKNILALRIREEEEAALEAQAEAEL